MHAASLQKKQVPDREMTVLSDPGRFYIITISHSKSAKSTAATVLLRNYQFRKFLSAYRNSHILFI